ncbi:MAG: 50S ribosome-binding GTPase, partial [Clostridia bacterium]|nr:50S ribosome-binding GTPase [Clostridia bacterium]
MNSGFVLVLSGPSGVGKDTVINELLKKDDKIIVSISMTTRQPRPGEVDGVNYYFVS